MFRRISCSVGRAVVLGMLLLVTIAVCQPTVHAASPADAAASLAIVPADVAFYSASLRIKEQIDIVASSRAWAALKAIPAVRMGTAFAQMAMLQPDSPWQQMQAFFAEPENQKLLEVIKDMVSDEIFYYGTADSVRLLGLLMEINNATQFAPLMAIAQGGEGQANRTQAKMALAVILKDLDRLVVPDIVIGFRTTKGEQAKAHLGRLETMIAALLESETNLRDRFERTAVGPTEYLSLKLDASMLPWDELVRNDFPIDDEQFDALVEKLKSLTATISLGVRGDYVVLSIGDTDEHLAQLGSSPSLAERNELARLTPHTDKRITGVNYASKDLTLAVSNPRQVIDNLAEAAIEMLPLSSLDADTQERARGDILALATELKQNLDAPGDILSVGMMNEAGLEYYIYNWAKIGTLDGSQPLSLLDHVGGQPLFAIVSRAKYSPTAYESLVKWIEIGYGYVEEIFVASFDEEEQQRYEDAMDKMAPLLARFDEATGSLLVPALADGQGALVLDAKITSRQWQKALPDIGVELPMLELAMVMGVSDAARLERAMTEYGEILRDALEVMTEISGEELPEDFKIPSADVHETVVGKIYAFALPEEAGIDAQIAPSAALNSAVAVLTTSPAQAERLLTKTPIEREGPLERAGEPLYSATMFDFAGLIDVIKLWTQWGVAMYFQENAVAQRGAPRMFAVSHSSGDGDFQTARLQQNDDARQVRMILEQINTGFEILKVFRGLRSATYAEDGVVVTHGQIRLVDMP